MHKTIISNVWNEEYLLPWWLNHHKDLFDHGIIMDYQSTDRSVEIIKDICPTWEVVTPTNPQDFSVMNNEENFERIERGVEGYKCILNTTEFLFHENFHQYVEDFDKLDYDGFSLEPISMVDPSDDWDEKLDHNIPLPLQKHHGFYEHDFAVSRRAFYIDGSDVNADLLPESYPWRGNRIIHKAPYGQYWPGRHGFKNNLINILNDETNIYMLWYGFSPRTTEMVQRKVQIRDRVPFEDQKEMRSFHHLWSEDAIKGWMNYLWDSVSCGNGMVSIEHNGHKVDLKEDSTLGKIYEKLYV
tara:strand:- start:779 stop:1675 length:897 start_codon:yes stop_codon:yes gene_type:complete